MTVNDAQAIFGGLALVGACVGLVYRDAMRRITRVEEQQAAYLSLLIHVSIKVGVDSRVIADIQKAIRSGS